jgi:hypothetical protein
MTKITRLRAGFVTFLAMIVSLTIQAQEKTLDVNIDVNKGDSSTMWYANPWIWVVGAAVFILLLAAILRSGKTSD